MVKKKRGLKYTFFILVFIAVYIYWQNNSLEVSRYTLAYDDLPSGFDGYRIVQISDMHGRTFGMGNNRLAARIKALKPDILLVTGDMMSSTVNDSKAFLDFLDNLGNASKVCMSLGNHEQIVRWLYNNGDTTIDYENFIEEIKKRGVYLLDNDKAVIEQNGDTITLEGLTLELYHYSRKDLNSNDDSLLLKKDYIEQVIGKSSNGFNILMAHHPAYFKEYAAWGADLVLAGHIHGGVIRIPFKGGLLSPERVFFPEYDAGLFEDGASKMVVNRGLGYSVINFRLFNRPEITFIELKTKE